MLAAWSKLDLSDNYSENCLKSLKVEGYWLEYNNMKARYLVDTVRVSSYLQRIVQKEQVSI